MGVLTDEMSISIKFGGDYDGTVPTFGATSIDGMITLQNFDVTDGVQMTDARGAGSKRARNRPHGAQGMFRLNHAVRMSGFMSKALGAGSPVGKWIQITVKPLSTLATPDVYQGLIETFRHSGERGSLQIEELSVNLDIDYGANA